jgi:hypothetical protein
MGFLAKRIELELPCTLSEAELQSRSMMLVETVATKDDTAAQKRTVSKEFNDKLTALDERQRQLAHVMRTGIERRMVACEVFFHTPAEASKRIVRLDTGEVVKEEAMTAAECQTHMFAAYTEFENFMKDQSDLPLDLPAEPDPEEKQPGPSGDH